MSEDNQEIKLHALDYWQVIRNRYGVILLAFFLVFMTATVITYMMPKEYLGRTTLQIHREAKDDVFFNMNSSKMLPYQTFMQTQFAIIESKENLDKVIKELKLLDEWGLATELDAYKRLVKKLRAQDVRGTDLVEIEFFDPDPKLAAKIADKIAESYQERRRVLEQDKANQAIEELELQVKAQVKLVDDSRSKMLKLMKDSGIVDLGSGRPSWMTGGGVQTGTDQIVMAGKMDEYTAKAEMESLRTTISTLMDLDGDELIKAAVQLGINNPTLATRHPEYESALLMERQLLDSGLGRKHPKVLAVRGSIEMLRGMLVEAVNSTKRTLGTQMEMAEKTLENVKLNKKSAEDDALDEKRRSIDYLATRDEYELHKALLAELKQRVATESVNQKMPRKSIEIHERAEVRNTPAKPNVNLQLAIGAILGLVFGVGLAFFLEYLDTSVKSLEDVERYLQVPVLAVIPKDVGVLHKQSGMSPDAEAYRILRTNIEFNRKNPEDNAITIVSPGGAGEGKSTTLVNLAYVCAQGGYTTLMIDA